MDITKPLCKSKTQKGTQCTRHAVKHGYCKQHEQTCEGHPPFKLMIGKAILAEANRNGSTRQYLKKYLEANYKISPKHPYTNKAIKMMIESGEIIVNSRRTGHYRLSPQFKKALLSDA